MGTAALLAGIVIPFIIIAVLFGVFAIICTWLIFQKAGKPGWAVLIPIYNFIVLLQIVGRPWWWLFLMLIPLVNIVITIMVYHSLSKSFGKDAGFTVGLVLLGIIFRAILAFSKSIKYIGPNGISAAGNTAVPPAAVPPQA